LFHLRGIDLKVIFVNEYESLVGGKIKIWREETPGRGKYSTYASAGSLLQFKFLPCRPHKRIFYVISEGLSKAIIYVIGYNPTDSRPRSWRKNILDETSMGEPTKNLHTESDRQNR
jgi:hypothetical protein